MARPKKDSRPFSIRMDADTYIRLNDYCENSGQPKTVAIERAINMFIDDYEAKMRKIEDMYMDDDSKLRGIQ